jgi:acyl carrier protein
MTGPEGTTGPAGTAGKDVPGVGSSTTGISEVEKQVLADVTGMIHEVIGEEYIVDMDIAMDTLFNRDLEMESIEFVTLAEVMRERYGDTVDFVGFLAEMNVDQVVNMAVGEVVEFIAGCLASGDPTGAGRHSTN